VRPRRRRLGDRWLRLPGRRHSRTGRDVPLRRLRHGAALGRPPGRRRVVRRLDADRDRLQRRLIRAGQRRRGLPGPVRRRGRRQRRPARPVRL
ncbi:MAG: hypothetical protein AVDCRST_MAG33-298, partial [uncultured Thermomicrobiales bacterium]